VPDEPRAGIPRQRGRRHGDRHSAHPGRQQRTALSDPEWARAIFEDEPAGPGVCGVRYRTAYHFEYSVALWDCDDRVEIVRDTAGRIQNFALDHPRMLGRFQGEMRKRRISVTAVPESDCSLCQRA
jgi:hypothetical protein